MANFLRVTVVYSTSHWVVPKIIIAILAILAVIIVVTEARQRSLAGEQAGKAPKMQIFLKDYDKLKFWGTLVIFALYIIFMGLIGFVPASIIFIFLFNLLFCGSKEIKSIVGSVVISVIATLAIWFLFGVVFNVSLPTASLF